MCAHHDVEQTHLVSRYARALARLLYAGVVVSFPGSEPQGWHVDGAHLSNDDQLPPHALTVFVAPHDVRCNRGIIVTTVLHVVVRTLPVSNPFGCAS